ncbi:MAG: glycine betaine ABC transporter substrate-binding protein [Deltaproteobacteria bacterium]
MRLRLILAALLISLLSGCGKNQDDIVIGSKNFTEQIVLGELLAQHLESHTHLKVERKFSLGGTYICQNALRSGEIDLYVEYTGTALTAILKEQPSNDAADVFRRVKAGYAKRFNLAVLDPLGFNNSFAMVIRGDDARRLKMKTISDIAPYAPTWHAAFGYEFMERPDGFKGLADTYRLNFSEVPEAMELGLLYRALLEKKADIVAGSATDGAIAANDFVVLQDDKHYFPPYDAVPVAREETLSKYPEVRAAIERLSGKISEDEMHRMNYAVDGEHQSARQVAADFLHKKGL